MFDVFKVVDCFGTTVYVLAQDLVSAANYAERELQSTAETVVNVTRGYVVVSDDLKVVNVDGRT